MELDAITKSKLIIIEGNDDEELLIKLAELLEVSGIQMIKCIGKGEMPDVVKTVKITPGFDMVSSLGIVRDADKDAKGVFMSICNALKAAGLDAPEKLLKITEGIPRVIVMIWPCDSNEGILEDVCLQSVADCSEMKCVERYFECLQNEGIKMPKNVSKAKVQTFLASQFETYPHLGVAAKKGCWQFDNKVFDELKDFLTAL